MWSIADCGTAGAVEVGVADDGSDKAGTPGAVVLVDGAGEGSGVAGSAPATPAPTRTATAVADAAVRIADV
ncbi:hypothetical protein MANY_13850 [Mycolicibacterium anyangense]|uniref:Uncharacterized protein n=1 Tax=Mycolicibacterium anyangense TaxID=1431246 RepID=A0A6N4W693_9MYCO|nr:hypothetical protein MANY_13850 [Mycolicibacterium anyangense]